MLIAIASTIYAVERRSFLAASAFVVGFASWMLYGLNVCEAGIAVPETIAPNMFTAWIMWSAV